MKWVVLWRTIILLFQNDKGLFLLYNEVKSSLAGGRAFWLGDVGVQTWRKWRSGYMVPWGTSFQQEEQEMQRPWGRHIYGTARRPAWQEQVGKKECTRKWGRRGSSILWSLIDPVRTLALPLCGVESHGVWAENDRVQLGFQQHPLAAHW